MSRFPKAVQKKLQQNQQKTFKLVAATVAGLISLAMVPVVKAAGLQAVPIEGKEKLPKPRWMYTGEKSESVYGTSRTLQSIKKSIIAQQFSQCIQLSRGLTSTMVAGWAMTSELECATQGARAKSVGSGTLRETLSRADNKSALMIAGAHKTELRKQYIEGRLILAELDQKQRRSWSWQSIDRLIEFQDWMSDAQRIQLLHLAGDLAFIEQKMDAAKRFTLMSLDIKESTELREKLSTIEKAIKTENKGKEDEQYIDLAKKSKGRPELEAQPEEEKLYESVQSLLKGGDLLSATEDAVRLINQFPGGRRADWAADQILGSYLKVDTGSSKNYFSEQSRMIRAMSKVDGLRQQAWASQLFDRGRYFAAKELAKSATKKLGSAARTRRLMMMAAEAALASGNVREAAGLFADVAKKHSGSKEAFHAIFRAGLAYYRLKEYSKAVAFFERMLVINDGSSQELSSRYWYWRSLQKIGSNKAKSAQDGLIEKFPLTYYGLRAAAEKSSEQLAIDNEEAAKQTTTKKKIKVWMTDSQKAAWNKFNALLRAGWLDEAQAELRFLGKFYSSQAQQAFAEVWGAALGYRQSIRLARESIGMERRLKGRSYIELTFPQEFTPMIKKRSEEYELDSKLLMSLIRQESGYDVRAVSHANAKGLMQLVPPTAKEMAERLKIKNFDPEKDLFNPEINIQFGSFYLSLMMKSFKKHVPLALAAYNAGPTRLRRWLADRDLLNELTSEMSSKPESEIWLDEMPWSETRFYVKSILRNYIIYDLLDDGRAQLQEPIWK